MDAADDKEVKLQRVSGDLTAEFSSKLPSLLWKSSQGIQTARLWASAAKTERLVSLLEPFQEWPQLLDPHLKKLLPPLIDAFLSFLVSHRGQYAAPRPRRHGPVYPLPRAVCRLLYTFCKVRGVKVISGFLNNGPRYLDPLLRAFVEWDAAPEADSLGLGENDSYRMIWEERYVMLLWLSHLLLAPFDLTSMSSDDIPISYNNLGQLSSLSDQTPAVASSLLSISLNYISVPGKEREAAALLLTRLALRGDMQSLGLLTCLVNWAFSILDSADCYELLSEYTCIGIFSFLARLGASGLTDGFASLVLPTFSRSLRLTQGQSKISSIVRSSASIRKLCIKTLRGMIVTAISMNERDGSISDDTISYLLEDVIDYFLVSLADKDTPVRFAASKALSIVTLRLIPDMAIEVIDAVIGSLEENILYEKRDGSLITSSEARDGGIHMLRRNLSAVNAQRWQGLILTLSHLLFRRAPPARKLPGLIPPLLSGLNFEQRLSTGSSLGIGVRDASCFGIWALSRKYTTDELLALEPRVAGTLANQEINILQMLAIELACTACVDPSGNIRRGASAALQELVGRHPDTIIEGIPLVQIVDYHAVARRSRAMCEVAKMTAAVDHIYWNPLLEALSSWRGIGSPDAESRRHAARAIGNLSTLESCSTIRIVFDRLLQKLSAFPRNDVEARHGCLLAIAATVDATCSHLMELSSVEPMAAIPGVCRQITELWEIFRSFGLTKEGLIVQSLRPELTAEAVARLVYSLSAAGNKAACFTHSPCSNLVEAALELLLFCISRGEEVTIEASSDALSQLFPLLANLRQGEVIGGWFSHIYATRKMSTACGEISALGAVFKRVQADNDLGPSIIETLLRCAGREELIERRVAAVRSLAEGVLPHIDVTSEIANHFIGFLNDYTIDRRGDIGSLIRLEAIQAARIILVSKGAPYDTPYARDIIGCLCRLAAEKLDKVRLQAWICLQGLWESTADFPSLKIKYEHFSHVSSLGYFLQLLELQYVSWLRLPLLQGIATSATSGAEGVIRAVRSAIIQHINGQAAEKRQETLIFILKDLSAILNDNLTEDRYAIPAIEVLAFLIDGYVPIIPEGVEPTFRKLFVLVQRAHFRSTNIARLEAAVKVYATLSRFGPLRHDVLKKLTTMLLHPFPRVRTCVAEYMFMETGLDQIKLGDWSRPAKVLKNEVEDLKALLL